MEAQGPENMTSPPPSPQPASIFEPLSLALVRCLSIVAIGYCCRRNRIFTPNNIEGISAFVARVALPALILLNMATLDISSLAANAHLVGAVLLAKSTLVS